MFKKKSFIGCFSFVRYFKLFELEDEVVKIEFFTEFWFMDRKEAEEVVLYIDRFRLLLIYIIVYDLIC